MQIRIVYLGGSRIQSGCAQEALEVAPGARVADAVAAIEQRHPRLGPLLAGVRWARNFEFVTLQDTLGPNDELALLPPVSGGAPRAVVTTEALSLDATRAQVAHDGAGATVLFLGTVRNTSRGVSVQALHYEAYGVMAERELERICDELSVDGVEVCIAHRVGELQVGDTSVVIAASAPHRDAAFDACRRALEDLKVTVPIYKKEVGEDGAMWVGWGGG